MIQDLKTEIERLVEPLLGAEGFDLIEIKLSRYKRNYRLQIFVDSDHGVTIGECAHLSRLVGTAMDTSDVIQNRYILEISSPGLDRPLHSDRDFKRKIGENMAVDVIDGDRNRTVKGILTGVEGDMLRLNGEDGEMSIRLSDVQQGRIII
jgi:ribosome maturation factor RimP